MAPALRTPLVALLLAALPAAAQTLPSETTTEGTPTSTLESAAEPAAKPGAARKESGEEMVVTGSRIRRKDLTTAAPVTVVSRQQFEDSGKMTIGDFLQTLPEQGNAPNFQLNTGGVNYGADGTTRINLRSLGIGRTLVLINGRRVVPGGVGASAAVDLNTIPTEAIERVEVLKDGASAVYGSDAVAGVVNIITRRTYNGTDIGAQYGLSQKGDAQTFDAHVTTGRSDEKSSVLFSVRYFNQKESWLRDRDWSAQALDYDYSIDPTTKQPGGVNISGSSGTPEGTVKIPVDSNGAAVCNGNALCLAMAGIAGWKPGTRFIRDPNGPFCGNDASGQRTCFRKFVTSGANPDFFNYAAQNYLTIPSTTLQAFSSGDVKMNGVRGYYEASYVQRASNQNAAPMPLNPGNYNNIVVSQDSIYNPLGTDLTYLNRRLVEFGRRTYTEDLGTFRVVTGLDGALPKEAGPLQGWYWDVSMNYGKTSGTFTTGGSFRNSLVSSAVGASMLDASGKPVCVSKAGDLSTVIAGCVPLNLTGGPGSITNDMFNYLGYTGTSRAADALFAVSANLTGDLFTLASERPVSLAVGYEFRRQSGSQIADPVANAGDSADYNFKSTSGFFEANEAFAELSIPILSNMPGVKELEANAAARYVNYNTFGGNFTYKFGARYTPVRDITFRGTFSTAFRAPNISELYLGAAENGPPATDPCSDFTAKGITAQTIAKCKATGVTGTGSGDTGTQETVHNGGNPLLKAETAVSYSGGVVFTPTFVKGLSVTFDYFNISIDNAVGTIGAPAILQGCYLNGNDTYCALVNRNKAGQIQFINDLNQNVGKKTTAGIDFAVKYALPTDYGRFGISFDANWLSYLDSTLVLASGNQVTHGQGNYDLGVLPAFKANVGLDWAKGGLSAGAIARYVGSIKECANPADNTTAQGGLCNIYNATTGGTDFNTDSRDVGSYVQVDAHVGYALLSGMGKTTLFVGVSNLFNQAPPYIYSAGLANSDPSAYDYAGRYVYGRVQHKF